MTSSDLQAWLESWEIKAADGAKILGVTKPRMSEWLKGNKIPSYIAMHVDTLNKLPSKIVAQVMQERLE